MKRLLFWDSLKFILIILVVYAHIISPYKFGSQVNMAAYNFIYSFHMPLFIFISGRFSHIRNKDSYQQRTLKLLETFIVFQILGIVILLLEIKHLSIYNLIRPYWIFWYLLVVVYYRLIVYYMPQQWLQYRKTILTVSFCISIAAGYLPIGDDFGIHRMLSFLPFFVIGYYATDIDLPTYINKISSQVAVGILAISFALIIFTMTNIPSHVLYHTYYNWGSTLIFYPPFFPAIRCLFIGIAVILSIMVMRLVPTNSRWADWGTQTLFIYTYHALALKVLFLLINKSFIPQNEWFLAIYTVAIIVGLLLLTRYKILHLLLNPCSSMFVSCRKTGNKE